MTPVTPLTVACVWVRGNVPYTAVYVERLASMVGRWLTRSHTFVCLTDQPNDLPAGVTAIPVARPRNMAAWWSKVQLFRPGLFDVGRVLYLDLDSIVVGSLDIVADYPAPAAFVPDGGTFQGRGDLKVIKRFNSSVMVFNAGLLADIYTAWSPGVARRLWGDQDWLGERVPHTATFPPEWFPRLSQCHDGPTAAARVVLAKVPKNLDAANRFAWVREAWR